MNALSNHFPNAHDAIRALLKCLVEAGSFRHRGRVTLVQWVCDWVISPNVSAELSCAGDTVLSTCIDAKSCIGVEHPHASAWHGYQCEPKRKLQPTCSVHREGDCCCAHHEMISGEPVDVASGLPFVEPISRSDQHGATKACFAVRVLMLIVAEESTGSTFCSGSAPLSPSHLEFAKGAYVPCDPRTDQPCSAAWDTPVFAATMSTSKNIEELSTPGRGQCALLTEHCSKSWKYPLQQDLLEWMMTSCTLTPEVCFS